ncbi:Uncharacterized membrane protein [Faunimonas pinastri]|uniref:Uncharacterized membrane protein n=1 Tax=Faunimonas pinastri TaxID=1855383 RepID=A0A1H9LGS2_9HYPH|nr:DUF2231 domain-containing protein [Faunimonas pinastri]SER10616.1 Uncharacterized membrane protein [Faunimonas pinastri]
MLADDSLSAVRFTRPPLHSLLLPIPATCLIGALLTDLAYWKSAEMTWADFSAWLVSAGAILAWIVGIIGVIDFLVTRRRRTGPVSWLYVLANLVVIALATLNMLEHTHDAWTSVMPWGLALSAVTAVIAAIALIMTWRPRPLVYRDRLREFEA